jgi:uncharacterized RDD family membrane protein YckC
MNQQIVEYLQKNKDNYTQESLVQQLRNAGHNEADIQDAVNFAYNDVNTASTTGSANEGNGTVHYAGFWIRCVAIFVDGLVLLIPFSAIFFISNVAFAPYGQIFAFIVIFILALLYFALMTNKYQATLGKMAVGIKVCDANTMQKASSGHICMREFINRIFLNTPVAFMSLLDIVVAFTDRKQGLHDMMAKTVVVYKDSNRKMRRSVMVTIVIIAIFVIIAIIAIIGMMTSIVLVSLNSTRGMAMSAAAKSSIDSTVPYAILCMDDGNDINPQIIGTYICDESTAQWPEIENGAWGTVIDGDVSDGDFEYTATYANGEEQAICTEIGCEFSDM